MEKQVKTIPGRIVDFDFKLYRLPTFVMRFKPSVYQDGDCYYAVLSLEDEHDISGLGTSPEDALIDWNDKVCKMLSVSAPHNDKTGAKSR